MRLPADDDVIVSEEFSYLPRMFISWHDQDGVGRFLLHCFEADDFGGFFLAESLPGAERMLGYTADEVTNQITPADISDPQEVVERAEALSVELGTAIAPGFEALVFKARAALRISTS
jgi:hypothetical protein